MEENLIINNNLNSALCEVEAVLKERLDVKIVGKLLDSEGPTLKVLFSRPEGYTDGKLIKEISDIGIELAVALPSFLMKFQVFFNDKPTEKTKALLFEAF